MGLVRESGTAELFVAAMSSGNIIMSGLLAQ